MTPDENKIKEIARQTFLECLQEFSRQLAKQSDDIKEIKSYITGDEYHPDGVIKRLEGLEEYVIANKSINMSKRSLRVIEWWEGLSKKKGTGGRSELQILQDGISNLESIQNLKNWAAFLGFTNIGTLLALVFEFFTRK